MPSAESPHGPESLGHAASSGARATAHSLERYQTVPADLHTVFAFFEDPHNLGEITPKWLDFRVRWATDRSVREGARIQYSIRWLGVPMTWESLIVRHKPNVCFADEMLRGPYKSWHHTHTFERVPEGVRLGDSVVYQLPLGHLGALAHALIVRRQLRAIFDHRAKRIAEIFGRT